MSFDRLIEAIQRKRTVAVMGLDPKLESIPGFIKEGRTAADALFEFNKSLIDCSADLIAAVKPQSAFYEIYGHRGIAALEKTIKYAKQAGLYVILDAKRGDIGSTAEAYAQAHLGSGSAGADCITVNPYLGYDGVKPFIDVARREDKALFILVKTSNRSSAEFQDVLAGDKTVYRLVAEKVEAWGAADIGEHGFSRCGAVIGATYPRQLAELREAMPHTFFLIPGYGAQGGTSSDAAYAFKNGSGAVVNSSRGLIYAYMNKGNPLKFNDYTRAAVIEMNEAFAYLFNNNA
ncbi:MAG: orotidine-5'-phosphate decarboxylase [Eubacteriales bacterium]|jgi:orotidine-5'-phosphate decarboxylase|nr:orotidine-5'-phosphate decarboxylase [Eubacteriales bacterium]